MHFVTSERGDSNYWMICMHEILGNWTNSKSSVILVKLSDFAREILSTSETNMVAGTLIRNAFEHAADCMFRNGKYAHDFVLNGVYV